MNRPRLLDFFCCAGGASAGYELAGFDVYGVDIEPQPHYPFPFHQGDALDVMRRLNSGESVPFRCPDGAVEDLTLDDFAAATASPPCQPFTAYRRKGAGVGDGYLNLIPETREALTASGLPYVIENVAGSPLNKPVQLCGSSFHLDVRRHRLFESNVTLEGRPCDHGWQTPRFAPRPTGPTSEGPWRSASGASPSTSSSEPWASTGCHDGSSPRPSPPRTPSSSAASCSTTSR